MKETNRKTIIPSQPWYVISFPKMPPRKYKVQEFSNHSVWEQGKPVYTATACTNLHRPRIHSHNLLHFVLPLSIFISPKLMFPQIHPPKAEYYYSAGCRKPILCSSHPSLLHSSSTVLLSLLLLWGTGTLSQYTTPAKQHLLVTLSYSLLVF